MVGSEEEGKDGAFDLCSKRKTSKIILRSGLDRRELERIPNSKQVKCE
jgi:hypothetical protein